MARGRRTAPEAAVRKLGQRALASLVEAAQATTEAGSLSTTLQTILDRAIALLDADEGSVMLFTADRSALRIRAAKGIPDDVVKSVVARPGQGIAGYVAASGRPLLLTTDEEVDQYAEGRGRLRDLRSAVSVPLKTGASVEGVLNVNLVAGGNARDVFTDADLSLASLFGNFAAASVHNARLYRNARTRAEQLAQLFELSHALSAAADVPEAADAVLDATEQLVGARGGFLVALGPEGGGPEIVGLRGVRRGRVMAVLRKDGFSDLLRGSTLRVIGQPEDDEVLAPVVAGQEPRTLLVAPLVGTGSMNGLLVVITDRNPPDDTRIRLLSTYTHHAAATLGRALLFRSIRTREDELTSLANSVPDPIVVTDAQGRFLALNPTACELFGLNPQFDIGVPVAGKLRSPELESLMLAADLPGRAEVTLFTPEPRTYRARATQVRAGHGPPGARFLTLEDVTAEKEMEQLKADFVAVIGHELRTPLTLVKGYTGTLAKRGDSLAPDARARALESVHRQAVHLERLIEDLLLVSRVERHRPALHVERVDLLQVMRDGIEAAAAEHPDHDLRLVTSETELPMLVDGTKLEQVMHHLLDNACKFSDPESTVRVEVEDRGADVEIRVRDEGQGIFSGELPRLFERFRQVDGTSTRAHGGTGIGLYICKTLVEAHGGHIGVTSALGRGSTFWFRIPTDPPPAEPGDVPTPEGQPNEAS